MKKGYPGTSLSDICVATGLTKGALYHHFSGKDDLYHQALDSFFQFSQPPNWMMDTRQGLKEQLHQGFKELDKSKRWIMRKVGSQKDFAILQFYSFLYEATRRCPEYQDRLDEYDHMKHKALAQSFRRAQEGSEIRADLDPEATAIELDALLQQLLYLRFVNHRVRTDDFLLEQMFENYWRRLEIPNQATKGS
jgi:AcrR family transcriptional regulator